MKYESDDSSSSGDEAQEDDGLVDSWVACDRCSKWRRVPKAVAQSISEDASWFCEQNPNKAFASCQQPQELSNEEIDAMEQHGEGHEGLGEEDAGWEQERARRRRMPAVWQLIRDNVLTHRKRKVQEEDDVMICHCKPVWRGGDGCGPDCINRMLCIECVAGFCPCEDKCTNQVFTTKQYAKLEVRRAGAKGFGLWATENIQAGQFIIEYIGEVLEEEEYLRRKDFYAEVGQRHYYFMNIGNGEVIDACRKGNRARFINHSCDPNCETQKWLARGELAIGLFAVKDIHKGEELTFDYNFERYGDKPMRCYCNSKTCRKSIGGSQQTYDESMLVDADDVTNDFPPIMLVDSDMDWATRALLDWRVGTPMDKEKEPAILARLEKICKARGMLWQPGHYLGVLPLPSSVDPLESVADPNAATAGLVAGSTHSLHIKPAAQQNGNTHGSRTAAAKVKGEQEELESAVKAAAKGAIGKPKPAAARYSSTGKAGTGVKEAVVKLEEASVEGMAPQVSSQHGACDVQPEATDAHRADSLQTELTQIAGLEQAGSKSEQAASLASMDGKADIVRPEQEAPIAKAAGTKQSSKGKDASTAEEDSPRVAALGAAKAAPLRRRLHPLTAKPDLQLATNISGPTASSSTAPTAKQQPHQQQPDLDLPSSSALSAMTTMVLERPTAGPAVTELASGSSFHTRRPSELQLHAPVSRPQDAYAPGRRQLRRRSEVDRHLERLVGPSGRMKDASRQNIIKVLRMFNLCDIGAAQTGPHAASDQSVLSAQSGSANHSFDSHRAEPSAVTVSEAPAPSMTVATAGSSAGPGLTHSDEAAGPRVLLPPLPAAVHTGSVVAKPSVTALPVGGTITSRQRARMADLSLLLDVILKTSSATVKKDFVTCGLLNQLHQAIGRNFSKEFAVLLRKMLRVIEMLPISADDLYSVRSAHGALPDVLLQLTHNQDYDVRTKAQALLKKYPASTVTDPILLQQLHAPPQRRAATGFSPAVPNQQSAAQGLPPMPGTDSKPRVSRFSAPLLAPGVETAQVRRAGDSAHTPASWEQPVRQTSGPAPITLVPDSVSSHHLAVHSALGPGRPGLEPCLPPRTSLPSEGQHNTPSHSGPDHLERQQQEQQQQQGCEREGPTEPSLPEPQVKRRRRGFSDGPQLPPPDLYSGEAVPSQLGPGPLGAPLPAPQCPLGVPGSLVRSHKQMAPCSLLPRNTPPAVTPAASTKPLLLPYSYRHGSALPPTGSGLPGAWPPPPPLDAEELFELLEVPVVLVERDPTYVNPVPPVIPSKPALKPVPYLGQQPDSCDTDKDVGKGQVQMDPTGLAAWGVHGLASAMEVVFAVGVYDTDWAADAAARRLRAAAGAERDFGPPLSPCHFPEVFHSPVRLDSAEREAERAWQQQRAAEGGWAAAMVHTPSGLLHGPPPEARHISQPRAPALPPQLTQGPLPVYSSGYGGLSGQPAYSIGPATQHPQPSFKPQGMGMAAPPFSAGPSPLHQLHPPSLAYPHTPVPSKAAPYSHCTPASQLHRAAATACDPAGRPPLPVAVAAMPVVMDLSAVSRRSSMLTGYDPGASPGPLLVSPGHEVHGPVAAGPIPVHDLHTASLSRLRKTAIVHSADGASPAVAEGMQHEWRGGSGWQAAGPRGLAGPGQLPGVHLAAGMQTAHPFTAHPAPGSSQQYRGPPANLHGLHGPVERQPPLASTPTLSASPSIAADVAEWARPMSGDYPETWDAPDEGFAAFVAETIRFRLGKYVTQPDHPNRCSSDDAHSLFKKIHREVVEKERQAFGARRELGQFKLIEKRKVEHNLKEFVRMSIRRLHTQAVS
ncbi:hypothetical protein QJQ45_014945 [Haematococcus lacustris]|nr:hypothetical protein QJQ45_014945 [Haematococcus lacustris]